MNRISSGIPTLDSLIDSFHIGDNVVWELEAGTSFSVFVRRFIARSFQDEQKVIYISFNRSPQTVLSDIGVIASPEHFTLVDCFTAGKGKNDSTFLKFYDKAGAGSAIRIDDPRNIERFTETLNSIEDAFPPGARYVFDSLTGMQDLWGDENETHRFFTYMCPRLYDLGTVAYWILEKEAHSPRFKANLRHITQVVLDLAKRKNSLSLKAVKLEGRQDREAFKPHPYEIHGDAVSITPLKKEPATDIGGRLKEERMRIGMSQKDLADRVSVTPSFLSQLESNQVSPSLPTFMQICRALGINPGQFLEVEKKTAAPWLIRSSSMLSRTPQIEGPVKVFEAMSSGNRALRIAVFPPGADIDRHIFHQKVEETFYVLKGEMSVTVEGKTERVGAGDVIVLKDVMPTQWKNEGGDEARLLVIS